MADGSELVNPDEISQILNQAKSAAAPSLSADHSAKLRQDEIEELIKENSVGGAKPNAGGSPIAAPTGGYSSGASGGSPRPHDSVGNIAPGDLDYLLSQAEQALASINAPSSSDPPPGVIPFRLVDFSGAPASTDNATLELVRDVELDVKIELGRTHMYLEDVLKLSKGAVVPLDKLAGDPVDIYVNGRLIARGEVLILNDNFCVRVAELVAGEPMAT